MKKLPYLTATLPGSGGDFQPSVDDFDVEEIPLYEPIGAGEHLYVRVRKRDLTTRQLVRRVVERLGADERNVGYAGLKDRHASTIQTISIQGANAGDAARLAGDGVEVLEVAKHKNKLRVGHLAGNRFSVRVHPGSEGFDGGLDAAAARAEAVLSALTTGGMPNFYGAQRFGRRGDNVAQARGLLAKGARRTSRWKAKLLVSALQSHLFNEVLRHRLGAEAFARVLNGDAMVKVGSGGPFTCSDPATDQARFDAWEISITGPIFGLKMRGPTEDSTPAQWEAAALEAAELTLDSFSRVKKFAQGTRRPLRAPVSDTSVTTEGDALRIGFRLPPGSYATVLMDEVLKNAPTRNQPQDCGAADTE